MDRSVRHSLGRETACIWGGGDNTVSDWCRRRLHRVLIGGVFWLRSAGRGGSQSWAIEVMKR